MGPPVSLFCEGRLFQAVNLGGIAPPEAVNFVTAQFELLEHLLKATDMVANLLHRTVASPGELLDTDLLADKISLDCVSLDGLTATHVEPDVVTPACHGSGEFVVPLVTKMGANYPQLRESIGDGVQVQRAHSSGGYVAQGHPRHHLLHAFIARGGFGISPWVSARVVQSTPNDAHVEQNRHAKILSCSICAHVVRLVIRAGRPD